MSLLSELEDVNAQLRKSGSLYGVNSHPISVRWK